MLLSLEIKVQPKTGEEIETLRSTNPAPPASRILAAGDQGCEAKTNC